VAERSHFELASDFDAPEPALRLRRGTEKGPSLFEPDPWSRDVSYFLTLAFLVRASDRYLLAKHLRQRRSRRLMKLGARSELPQ
jgi:hypothetical protein